MKKILKSVLEIYNKKVYKLLQRGIPNNISSWQTTSQ